MLNVNITLTNGLDVDIEGIKNIRCMDGNIYVIAQNGNKTRLFKEQNVSSIICVPSDNSSTKEVNDKKMIEKANEIIAGNKPIWRQWL